MRLYFSYVNGNKNRTIACNKDLRLLLKEKVFEGMCGDEVRAVIMAALNDEFLAGREIDLKKYVSSTKLTLSESVTKVKLTKHDLQLVDTWNAVIRFFNVNIVARDNNHEGIFGNYKNGPDKLQVMIFDLFRSKGFTNEQMAEHVVPMIIELYYHYKEGNRPKPYLTSEFMFIIKHLASYDLAVNAEVTRIRSLINKKEESNESI
jgi:hypothetical protein